MPFDIQWEPSGVVVRYFGPFTPVEALGSAERISGHERMDGLRYILLDFGAVDRCELGPLGARALDPAIAIAIGVSFTNPDIVIATSGLALAVRAIIRGALAQLPYRQEFFENEQDAREWIRRVLP